MNPLLTAARAGGETCNGVTGNKFPPSKIPNNLTGESSDKSLHQIVAGRGFFFAPAPFISVKVTVDEEYNHDKMVDALFRTEAAHPILNNVIVKNKEGLFFKNDGHHVKLTYHDGNDRNTWEGVLKNEVCRTVDIQKEPGVFLHVIDNNQSFDVLLICHHIYGDGVSVKQVLGDLLYCYVSGKPIAVREPLTGLSKWNMPADYHVAQERKDAFYNLVDLWDTRNTTFNFEDFQKLNELHHASAGYGMEYVLIRGANLRRLKALCKQYDVTINSAITTAIMPELQGPEGVQAIIAANTRPIFGLEQRTGMANFASAMNTFFKYDNSMDFWTNVRDVNYTLADIKQNKPQLLETLYAFLSLDEDLFGASYLAKYGLYTDMEVLMGMMSALNVGTAKDAFGISNLGHAQFVFDTDDVNLRDFCFIPNVDLGSDYKFGVISIDNCLSITLSYASTRVSKDKAKAILRNVVNRFY